MCNIKYSFVDTHRGEYWYECVTCGAMEWFARNHKPNKHSPIRGCKDQND